MDGVFVTNAYSDTYVSFILWAYSHNNNISVQSYNLNPIYRSYVLLIVLCFSFCFHIVYL